MAERGEGGDEPMGQATGHDSDYVMGDTGTPPASAAGKATEWRGHKLQKASNSARFISTNLLDSWPAVVHVIPPTDKAPTDLNPGRDTLRFPAGRTSFQWKRSTGLVETWGVYEEKGYCKFILVLVAPSALSRYGGFVYEMANKSELPPIQSHFHHQGAGSGYSVDGMVRKGVFQNIPWAVENHCGGAFINDPNSGNPPTADKINIGC
ncbi:hypothetical protein T484DRAFT_3642568, partial [Baffinella frigidus]